MKSYLLGALKGIACIAALFVILRYLGEFSDSQSVLLALIFCEVLWWRPRAAKEPKFVPFRVDVIPSLHNILQDFDLVKPGEEGSAEIRAGIENLSKEYWNIWKTRSISFSFITRELIYNTQWQTFSVEEIDISASLKPVVIVCEDEKLRSLFGDYTPSLNLSAGLDHDCILRLTLPDLHWGKIKNKENLKSITQDCIAMDHMTGTVDVILARIPPQEFGLYSVMRGAWDKNDADAYNKALKARKEARTLLGWRGKIDTDLYGRETDADQNNETENRYCTVEHSAL